VCEYASREKDPFFSLCALLRDRKLLADNINSCVEEQVAMFLHMMGTTTLMLTQKIQDKGRSFSSFL
jgi:hypothetical protein